MTQSINKPFKANEAAKQVEQLRKSLEKTVDNAKITNIKPAPAVAKVQQGLVPAPKAAKTSPVKKSGRVVGISADENKLLQALLQKLLFDDNYATIINDSQIAFDKLIGRYNK